MKPVFNLPEWRFKYIYIYIYEEPPWNNKGVLGNKNSGILNQDLYHNITFFLKKI